ncbi:MAG: c-type cytochrome domain-containing protein [Verrucomicrobiota bacterium]
MFPVVHRWIVSLWLVSGVAFAAEEPKPAQTPIPIARAKHSGSVDFEKEILPILRRNCLACHSQSRTKGGLVLESPKDILKGGDSGKAVVPRRSGSSLLLQVAAHQKEPLMPPLDNKTGAVNLTSEELGLLRLWIDQGAKGTERQPRAVTSWQPQPAGLQHIYAVALTADGQYAACNRANRIYLYHVPTQKLVAELIDDRVEKKMPPLEAAHRDLVFSLAFSPDGQTLASGSFREVKLWQRGPLEKLALDAVDRESVAGAALSPDGLSLATAGSEGLKLWDVTRAKAKRLSREPATSVAFSPDGAQLLSVAGQTITLWSFPGGKRSVQLQVAHGINTVAWLGRTQFALGGTDGAIRLWSLPANPKEPPQPLKELKGTNSIRGLAAIGLDGAQLASGGKDGVIRIWDIAKSEVTRQADTGAPVVSLDASPDGKRLVSAGTNAAAKLWNAADGKLVAELKGNHRLAEQLAALERETAFLAGEINYRKGALQTATNELKAVTERVAKATNALAAADKTLKEKEEPFTKAKAAKEAADKALADADAELKKATDGAAAAAEALKVAEAGAKAARETNPPDKAKVEQSAAKAKSAAEAKAVADKLVAEQTPRQKQAKDKADAANKTVGDTEREFKKAETARSIAEHEFQLATKAHEAATDSVKKAEETLQATETLHKQTDAGLQAAKKSLPEAAKTIRTVAFSPDGRTLATSGDDALIHTWNAETGAPIEVLSAGNTHQPAAFASGPPPVISLAFGAEGSLVSVSANRRVVLWNLQPGWTLARTIGGASPGKEGPVFVDRVNAVAFSPDGRWLATGGGEPSRSGEIKLCDAATGQVLREFNNVHSDAVLALDFSADGKWLASGAADKFLRVLDLEQGAVAKSFEGHTHHVLGVSWRRDARTLASAGADNVVKLWDFITGARKRNVEGFGKEVTSVHFIGTSDQFIATAGDGQVRLAQEDGKEIRRYPGATPFVFAAAATPDGKLVVAGGEDGVLRVWNGADGKLIAAFEPPKPPQQLTSTTPPP